MRYDYNSPVYPRYPSQPNRGTLPSMNQMGPSDASPGGRSAAAPDYRNALLLQTGRQLGSTAEVVQDEAPEPGYAWNELKVLAEADDVQGDGIFDAPGAHPNIYPDAGVLAARFGIPGYLARERMFEKSEVVDATTGRPTVHVNAGAVSMDSIAQIAYLERNKYGPMQPVVRAGGSHGTGARSITNVRVNAEPIKGLGETGLGTVGWLAVLGVVGLAAGAAYAKWMKG
jgi:hypothetical protein